uniref:MD-2-related lipid-recognition domain-containing protein n=1 Tax=Anopheles dirus TaxID=7168 RepID=A0A182N741_9DIPT
MRLLAIVFTISLAGRALADVVTVHQCSEGPVPLSVDVLDCRSAPCELPRGQDAAVMVEFTASKPLSALVPKVHASIGGLTVPFELPDDRKDACNWLVGAVCPISRGEDVMYELRLPILASYPSLSLTVELKLVDQEQGVVTCFQLQAKVV